MSYLDGFFNLGNKATRNDPLRKAYFDYCLYWIVFIAFIFLAFQYFYFFAKTLQFKLLMWGLIMIGISWFNYWGLVGLRNAYTSIKKIKSISQQEIKEEDVEDMLKDFK